MRIGKEQLPHDPWFYFIVLVSYIATWLEHKCIALEIIIGSHNCKKERYHICNNIMKTDS